MVQILSVSCATPPLTLTQEQVLKFVRGNVKMKPATGVFYEKVLKGSGIKNRHFALKNVKDSLEEDPDAINRRFEKQSVELSAEALKRSLSQANADPKTVDLLVVSTCTGYLCPGISSRLIETCGLRPDVRCLDIVGMGCGSAIPALEAAHNFIKAHPKSLAAAVSTEICSSAIYWDDAPDLVVSNALFADGSAAVLLSNSKSRGRASIQCFGSVTLPEWRESLRFKSEGGRLRNVLKKEVPALVAKSLSPLIKKILAEAGLEKKSVRHWVFHSGGAKILDAIQKALALTDQNMRISRKILRNYGNLSSPTVLFGLEDLLSRVRSIKSGDKVLIASFGAGFSAYACLLELR